jgi:hypothetical protein
MAAVVLGLFGGGDVERVRERLGQTPLASPGEVTPGPVAVEGVAREHRERIPEPAGEGEALVVRYRRRRRGAPEGEVAEERSDAVPFVVEGEDGRVLVDPREAVEGEGGDNYAVFSERGTRHHVGGVDPASAVPLDGADGDATTGDDGTGTPPPSDGTEWIHVQSGIRPGDRVFVLGEAAETPGGSPPYVVRPGADGGFLVSDLSAASVREQLARESGPLDRGVWRIALLGVIAVLGVAVVLLALLVVVNVFVL